MNGGSKARFWLREWPKDARERQAYVDPIFATIAAKYDFMTRVLSLGQEQRWKKHAVELIPRRRAQRKFLDLATGTGDFLLHLREAGFKAPIIALDRNPRMLGFSIRKCSGHEEISFIHGDLMEIPFKDRSFDVVTMGYGLRYVADIRQTLKEVFRLLASGGFFVCLDFGLPRNRLYRRLCFAYLLFFGSLWGLVLHGKVDTYWHIVESLKAYPGQEIIKDWVQELGFCHTDLREELGGIITILSAVKP